MRSNVINLAEFRRDVRTKLTEKGDQNPDNTSLVLIAFSLNKTKSWILAHGEYELTSTETHTLQNYLAQYLQGVPLPYILGSWDFYSRPFKVSPDVLIPRPETELLVEKAIDFGQSLESLSIIDVGTGSGIIAVSLAANLAHADVFALDISRAALAVAKENARSHDQTRIKFIQSDLLTPLQRKFNLICANLPYIPSLKIETLQVAKWEPRLALDGGISGLNLIERLLEQAKTHLSPGGCLLLEIESSLGKPSLDIASDIFPEANRQLIQDLTGFDRVLQILLP
ncbi:MAG: peptide chain release factor N(5)-glutamine methyltransferase [Chloroflexota bacterium]|nr:peptide chain release factor N(5)-glutamine methyltransferase [Chloroflexota bacterium]